MAKMKAKKQNIARNNKGTLDQKHIEQLNIFEKLQKSIPHKREKLMNYQRELERLKNLDIDQITSEEICRKTFLLDNIQKLKREIEIIANGNATLKYISDTLPILIDYYDNKNIESEDEEEYVALENKSKKNILSYFSRETKRQESKNTPKNKTNRSQLYNNYLEAIDATYKNYKDKNICNIPECNGEKIYNQSEGCMVCNKCGDTESVLISIEKANYKEPIQDMGTYAYKRINHLTEILSQLQAKESTEIPPKVFENILRELKKRKINKDDLDIFYLRRILKKLNYRKYYEHVPHILQIINGKEPPNFSRKDEMRIKKMFKEIQEPFAIFCPKNRKNFLNYSYVLHKFCELLDLDEYINYFPLLKNNSKLLQHDKIWKNICQFMKWKYYKSL
jgi:hypothetical protein